jgi:PAS domain S-box-containing protein
MKMGKLGTFLRHRRESSISRQVVLLLLVFSIIPMAALLGLFYIVDTSVHREEIVQVQDEVANRVSQAVLLHIQSSLNSLRLLALSLELMERDLSQSRRYLSGFLFDQSEFNAVALARIDGMSVVRISRLQTYHQDEQEWLGGEQGFQQAMQGQLALGGVQISPGSRFPQLRIYVPVKGRLDRVLGVICADMNISQMWRLVSKSFTGKDVTAYIVDRDGFLIASDDLSVVLERKDLKKLPAVVHFLAGEHGVFEYYGIGDHRVVGVVAEMPLTGWGVVVETPAAMAYSHMHLLWRVLGPVSLGAILFAGICGWLFSVRSILRPIRALQKDVQIIATGDLTHQVSLERSDELGKLAADLSIMTDNLRTLTVSREMLIHENRERRKTEEALRENERRLSDILNFLPDATLAIDEEKRVIIWNKAIEEMTGVSSEEMIGKGDYAYTVPFYGERRRQLMDLVWRPSAEVASMYPYIRQEGHSFIMEVFCPSLYDGKGAWVFAKASPLHDQQGNVIGAIESIRDITDRKRTEDALEKRILALTLPPDATEGIEIEELFNLDQIQKLQDQFAQATGVASIITHTDGAPITRPSKFHRHCDSIVCHMENRLKNRSDFDSLEKQCDPEGAVIEVCSIGGLLNARSSIGIGGRHIANWLIWEIGSEIQNGCGMLEDGQETGADVNAFKEAYCKVSSMSRNQFEKIAQVLFTLAGQLSSMAYQNIQQARFITELKRAQEEKERLQTQLLQSQKMESVGRLAGGVAHDFNNMLQAILGHAEMALMRVELMQPIHNDLREIQKAAQRSADLTRQLLAFARKQAISPRVLDVNETVEGMLKMLRRLIGEDVELLWKPGLNLWPVEMDPTQIDQILANLCVNARDAILGVGKVTIETANIAFDETYCREHADSIPGDFVMIAVSDDGCGMSSAILDNLFEPFFTTKELGKGTGLGLATVYGIVKQNNGFITVHSEPGTGAAFKMYFPRTFLPPSREQYLQKENRDLRGTGTILLVEDEEHILALGKAVLEHHGYEVLTARNPVEALEASKSHAGRIHLLITDVVMPGMNGKELNEQLSALKPGFKCIFMSGYTANIIARHGVMEEGVHFLQKPFSVKAMAEKVQEVLADCSLS